LINNDLGLANILRPKTLDDYIGQEHIIGKNKMLRKLIERDNIPSIIFWGPPGVGKTTLAKIIANKTKANFVEFSAALSSIKDIKPIINKAENDFLYNKKTLIFIDEIHRFNKLQQDIFLSCLEKKIITLIGATTENPSFEMNSALLSRCKVFVLKKLSHDDLKKIFEKINFNSKKIFGAEIKITDELLDIIINFSDGDARIFLNTFDIIINNSEIKNNIAFIDKEIIEQCIGKKILFYDKNGEEHFNLISALHKSMRNSDVDAAIYWLIRMLESGEDPLYIARRIIRFASEDIGIANSKALEIAINCFQACSYIGMPECNVNLAHAVIYCALSPKSNSIYKACNNAKEDVLNTILEPVPLILRNAETNLMRELNYGVGYKYAHDFKDKIPDMQCLPNKLANKKYYEPTNNGKEKYAKELLEKIKNLKSKK
jgi:putative ATPase